MITISTIDANDPKLVLSPLADPVVNATLATGIEKLNSKVPKIRKEYMLWFNDRMREEGEKEWLIQTAQKDRDIAIARNLLQISLAIEEIAKATGLTIDEVSGIKEKF